MTTLTEELPLSEPTPLTNPVKGAWMQPIDGSLDPVYVPYEPQHRKDERTQKDVVVGYGPGAHIQRLLSEKWMYTNGPAGVVPAQNVELAATEMALRAELDQSKAMQEAMFAELQALRQKLENDTSVPNAAKKR